MREIDIEPVARNPMLKGVDDALRWIPLAIAGASMLGGMLGSKKKTKVDRVPATLSSGDLRPTAKKYQGVVNDYLDSAPGLKNHEVEQGMQKVRRDTAAGTRGSMMKTQAYMSKGGIRGAGAAGVMNRMDENRKAANYQSRVGMFLQEHAIKESDIARRAAVGAGFLWPAEQARGAGQMSGTVSGAGKGEMLGAGISAGSRAYGQMKDA